LETKRALLIATYYQKISRRRANTNRCGQGRLKGLSAAAKNRFIQSFLKPGKTGWQPMAGCLRLYNGCFKILLNKLIVKFASLPL
jgi:hypothetical protein